METIRNEELEHKKFSSKDDGWAGRVEKRRIKDEEKAKEGLIIEDKTEEQETEPKQTDTTIEWEIFGNEIITALKNKQLLDQKMKIDAGKYVSKLLREVTAGDKKVKEGYAQLQKAAEVAPDDLENIFYEYFQSFKNLESEIRHFPVLAEGQNDSHEVTAKKLAKLLVEKCKNKEISDTHISTIISSLELYQTKEKSRETEMEEKIKRFVEKFKKEITKAITRGVFPISPEVVEERMALLNMYVIDPIESKLRGYWGGFRSDIHSVVLSSEIPEDNEPRTFLHKIFSKFTNSTSDKEDTAFAIFAHEVFHSISGLSEVTTGKPKEKKINTRVSRLGLQFYKNNETPSEDQTLPELSFGWLNEAITQQAVIDLLGEKKAPKATKTVYSQDRQLVQKLIQKGIPRDTIYKAYFDNYSIGSEEEHRTPNLRELFVQTNEKLGKRFLINLDRYITKTNVQQAIQSWDSQGENFPQYLENWNNEQRKK